MMTWRCGSGSRRVASSSISRSLTSIALSSGLGSSASSFSGSSATGGWRTCLVTKEIERFCATRAMKVFSDASAR